MSDEAQTESDKPRPLRHYCVVRSDLSVGQKFAQLGHAAGESAFRYAQRTAGSEEPPFLDFAHFIAVEGTREQISVADEALRRRGFRVSVIVEDEGPFVGQVVAFGVEPSQDNRISKILYHFRLLA